MGRNVDLADLIGRAQESRLADVWTATAGVVESYDPTTRTADVRVPILRPVPNADTGETEHEKLPVLPSIPVLFPASPYGGISWPIPVGTTGLVLFLTLSIGKWRAGAASGATPAEPGDLRLHHPGNAVFIPGLVPDAASTPRTGEDAIVIEGAEVRLGTFDAADNAARASIVNARLDALESFANSHTHPENGTTTSAASPLLTPGGGDVASPTIKIP